MVPEIQVPIVQHTHLRIGANPSHNLKPVQKCQTKKHAEPPKTNKTSMRMKGHPNQADYLTKTQLKKILQHKNHSTTTIASYIFPIKTLTMINLQNKQLIITSNKVNYRYRSDL
jgi:hypothetical protein